MSGYSIAFLVVSDNKEHIQCQDKARMSVTSSVLMKAGT